MRNKQIEAVRRLTNAPLAIADEWQSSIFDAVVLAGPHGYRNLKSGVPLTRKAGAPQTIGGLGVGVEANVSATQSISWTPPVASYFADSYPYSVLLVFETLTASSAWGNYSNLWAHSTSPIIQVNGRSDVWYLFQLYYGSGTPSITNLVSKPSDFLLKPGALLLACNQVAGGANTSFSEYKDGVALQTDVAIAAAGGSGTPTISLGGPTGAGAFQDVRFYAYVFFNRTLKSGEALRLTRRPFSWLKQTASGPKYFAGTSPPPPPPSTYIGARFQMIGSGIQQFSGGRAA